MKYVTDGEVRWTSVVRRRRKKSTRIEDGDDRGNSNIKLNLIEGGRGLVRYREINGITGIHIRGSLQASRWVAVKPSLISSELELK